MTKASPILFVILLIAAFASAEDQTANRAKKIAEVYAAITPEQSRGYVRLGAPKSGDWLFVENETPETLVEFTEKPRIYPNTSRYKIVFQPLGNLNPSQTHLLSILQEYSEAFFQLPSRIDAPVELKIEDKRVSLSRTVAADRFNRRTEYDGDVILDNLLQKKLPEDAVIYVGVTSEPLISDGRRILGIASLDRRVAACSMYRVLASLRREPAEDPQTIRRLCKLFSHEIGHAFGLDHCVFYRCAMNGCNGLLEADSTPMHFCPVCSAKICFNNGIEPEKRDAALEAFFRKYHLEDEAKWMADRRQNAATK